MFYVESAEIMITVIFKFFGSVQTYLHVIRSHRVKQKGAGSFQMRIFSNLIKALKGIDVYIPYPVLKNTICIKE